MSASVGAGPDHSAGVPVEPGTARIAVDLLGGDDAPAVVVDGALRALAVDPDLYLLLVGPPEVAGAPLDALSESDRARVALCPVWDAVMMTDAPVRAGRARTTVGAAVAAVNAGRADAVVSAGATGATVTAAAVGFGRWPEVRRPALVATLPGTTSPVALLDVGASLEARPGVLARHAVLGAGYAALVHRATRPRVGLLSVGVEPGKGDRVRRATETVLAATPLPCSARYVGLVEGYDVTDGGRADVIVTDGFTGNVLLKGIEGAYALAGGPPERGGAPRAATLLGVAGTVVVCHGASGPDDIASGVALAAYLHRRGAIPAISALLPAGGAPDDPVDREHRYDRVRRSDPEHRSDPDRRPAPDPRPDRGPEPDQDDPSTTDTEVTA